MVAFLFNKLCYQRESDRMLCKPTKSLPVCLEYVRFFVSCCNTSTVSVGNICTCTMLVCTVYAGMGSSAISLCQGVTDPATKGGGCSSQTLGCSSGSSSV
jgi:hypothetical protein